MTTQTEALKLAHEELKHIKTWCLRSLGIGLVNENVLAKIEETLAQPEQKVDWEKLYRLEVKKKEALAAKYERDIKPLTKIVPMAQPQQEPAAYIGRTQFERLKDCGLVTTSLTTHKAFQSDVTLYTTPPQRTWVGLTPEEIDSLANLKVDGAYLSVPDTIRQTDAKLKEKNT